MHFDVLVVSELVIGVDLGGAILCGPLILVVARGVANAG
jgi:hypothetical protein